MNQTTAKPSRGRPPKRDLNRSPLIVFYETTQACGLVCKHCRACAQTEASPNELSTSDSYRLIDQLTEFPEPPMLVLTGGDPFCREDLFDLVDYATKVGLEVSITPSATPLVTEEALHKLRDAGIHRLAISIDGADAKTHDDVRGVEGSYARSLEILNSCRALGIPTQVNTTITPNNLDQIDDMAELMSELGIVMWSVFFLVPVGRAENAERLSADEFEQAFELLWSHSQNRDYFIKTTEAPHYRRFAVQQRTLLKKSGAAQGNGEAPRLPLLNVNDGKGILFVSHTGVIHPSGFMPLVCGVFPFQNVVNVYQDSQIFQDLRDSDLLEGKCGECEYRNICGGSRARSYALTGNPFAEEPDCAYYPPGTEPVLK